MHNKRSRNICLTSLLTCIVIFSTGVFAGDYDRFIVFGDSLSDPGNAFALSGTQSVPPYETLDAFQLLRDAVADPQKFGLKNAVDACVTPGSPPPSLANNQANTFSGTASIQPRQDMPFLQSRLILYLYPDTDRPDPDYSIISGEPEFNSSIKRTGM